MIMMNKKGISTIVASVLLIAFTVAVAGILITWLSGFTSSTTTTVGNNSQILISCSQGSINLRNLKFASASSTLSGVLENTGLTSLSGIGISIIYLNATSQSINLCTPASLAVSCSSGNLTLTNSQPATFNVTIGGSNYNEIRASTSCSGVFDTATRGDVSSA